MSEDNRAVRTVSELAHALRITLTDGFSSCWVEGELSGFKAHGSGHWYFSLKDDRAQVRAAMFARDNRRVRFAPKDGDRVLIRGRVDLYEPRGDLQIIVEHIEPRGQGALLAEFERLKTRLQAEGLFDPAKKRALPPVPRRVGIVTSESGAALHDMLRVLRRRDPWLQIVVAPARVQGAGAKESIAAALALLATHGAVEVILCGRGGGSLEDLWAFNEEAVVRAIASCPIPVVSCVGHETDITLADFAADLRAPTPSAAAEMVVPELAALLAELGDLGDRLGYAVRGRLTRERQRVDGLERRLIGPRRRIEVDQQRLDDLRSRLDGAVKGRLTARSQRFQGWSARLHAANPERRLLIERKRLGPLRGRLLPSLVRDLRARRQAVEALRRQLLQLGPLQSLERGFALPLDERGRIPRDAAEVAVGSALWVQLARGRVQTRVEAIDPLRTLGDAP